MSDTVAASSPRFVLRDLPLSARMVLAVFLLSVGIGYFSALVNLHFQSASPGEGMPTKEDVIADFHGKTKQSQFIRLLQANDTAPFNGQGSMRSAFTRRAPGLAKKVRDKATALNDDRKDKLDLKKHDDYKLARGEVMKDLDGERISLILWGSYDPDETKREQALEKMKGVYENDEFVLPEKYKDLQITEKYVKDVAGKRAVMIKSILEARCVRCHSENVGGPASNYPLESWEELSHYLHAEAPTGKSLEKLALTTHVHLLGFSVLYGFTGLIFAFSSYPGFIRFVIAPLPLLAQVVDISFWWLARMDPPHGPLFAEAIIITGGIVGASLGLQILLSLFNLFGKFGKFLLVLLLAGGIAGGYYVKTNVIDKHLEFEKGLVKVEQ